MKVFALLLFLTTAPAFAVRVNDCPARIEVQLEGLTLDPLSQSDNGDLDEGELAKLKEVRERLEGVDKVKAQLGLAIKEDSECRYGGYRLVQPYQHPRAKFFTKSGDWLRFAAVVEGRDVGVYVKVTEYSNERVSVDPGPVKLIFSSDENHGEFSGTVYFGKFKKVTVDVLD